MVFFYLPVTGSVWQCRASARVLFLCGLSSV
nr:MAG TPA: hypothetical protein [Caudoviricetes sp.]